MNKEYILVDKQRFIEAMDCSSHLNDELTRRLVYWEDMVYWLEQQQKLWVMPLVVDKNYDPVYTTYNYNGDK